MPMKSATKDTNTTTASGTALASLGTESGWWITDPAPLAFAGSA
jgi:hypothetical protein